MAWYCTLLFLERLSNRFDKDGHSDRKSFSALGYQNHMKQNIHSSRTMCYWMHTLLKSMVPLDSYFQYSQKRRYHWWNFDIDNHVILIFVQIHKWQSIQTSFPIRTMSDMRLRPNRLNTIVSFTTWTDYVIKYVNYVILTWASPSQTEVIATQPSLLKLFNGHQMPLQLSSVSPVIWLQCSPSSSPSLHCTIPSHIILALMQT